VACSSGGDGGIDVVFDVCQTLVLSPEGDLTEEQALSIDDAIEMWNRLGDSRLTREEISLAPRLPIRFEEAAANFHGVYEDEIGVVYVNLALVDRHERAVTIAHEVGHAFGLVHVDRDQRLSVMNQGNLEVEPLSDDGEALSTLWGDCP